jgi:hypothetical protein
MLSPTIHNHVSGKADFQITAGPKLPVVVNATKQIP